MRQEKWVWPAAAVLATMLWCGCAGILAEKVNDEGKAETLRLGTSDKWSTWDRNSTKKDESVFMLKKESTF
jgi:hypothetical protein